MGRKNDAIEDFKDFQVAKDAKSYVLTDKQKAFILKSRLKSSYSQILSQLFGDNFDFSHVTAVYKFMEESGCFDYCHNAELNKEVLELSKMGIDDADILERVRDKYDDIGLFQVSSIIVANVMSRRVGKWTNADQRLLMLTYGAFSKKALLQAFYPRRMTNIQKKASNLCIEYESPAKKLMGEAKDYITVGELRELLKECKDSDKLYISGFGSKKPFKVMKAGHRTTKQGVYKHPYISVWNI